jgi:hypothetical protein
MATKAEPAWVNRPGGPLRLPPLLAITHKSVPNAGVSRAPASVRDFRSRTALIRTSGSACVGKPAAVSAPDDYHLLSALYGAARKNHDLELTKILARCGRRSQ